MSSHREAPEISKDPVADNTDVYAFVSPDKPDTVTIITNYIPLRGPGRAARTSSSSATTSCTRSTSTTTATPSRTSSTSSGSSRRLRNPNTFLYNTGPITSLNSPNWNRRQFYSVHASTPTSARPRPEGQTRAAASPSPPCNIGPRSTPNYADARDRRRCTPAVRREGVRRAAQRRVLRRPGAIFDLGDLRPFQNLHLIPTPGAPRASTRLQDAQRPHDRDPGPDQAADPRRLDADRPDERQGGARHLGRRAAGARCG